MKEMKRPTTRFERARLWIVLAVLIFIAAIFITSSKFESIKTFIEKSQNTFNLVIGLGIVTLILILIPLFYTFRKRALQEKMPGTMMAWLQSHVYLGLLSLGVVFVHIWVPSFSDTWTSGKTALAIFALLVVSGVVWRIVYVVIPPQVAKNVGNLAITDTEDKARITKVEIDKLLAGKPIEFQRAAQKRLSGSTQEKFEGDEYGWSRFVKLADRLSRYTKRETRQKRYASFLQGWKALHIPLSVILIAVVGIHIWETMHVPNIVANEVQGLPPASACADCHAEIVEEWRVAMHAQAQNAPIIISQTNLALEKFPEFGRACNNCHAPIGTSLTDTPTLPIDVENQLRIHPNGAVVDDGVTCIVCHTISEAPEERRGMFDAFPFEQGNANTFANMFGPNGGNTTLPSTRHGTGIGFMTDSIASSQLCGSCHNVKVDIDGNGEITAFPGSEGNGRDSDRDNQLDENELEFEADGKTLKDLVLQTTFDEWQDYVATQEANNRLALGCVDCHMPLLDPAPIADSAPGSFFADAPERPRHSHHFVGVDYSLTPGYYEQEGMPEGIREYVLEDREKLLRSAMNLFVDVAEPSENRLSATVTVQSTLDGHNLPTGFAFARQMWLEVYAETSSGRKVCLADFEVNGVIIIADCASGQISSPQAELKTCDPLALAEIGLKASKNDELVKLNPLSVAPLSRCDPYLTNFQKILSDGDFNGDGIFEEVEYQSLFADIVKTRVRTFDQQAMDALNTTILINGEPHDSASYEYVFDLTGFEGETITITAIMRFRHLPPYFIKALNDGYPNGITADDLLENMTVVDIVTVESVPVSVP
ncbi:MAG TPA: hypothetical protein DEP19_09145 [Anaerolineae bacterium]|nr:hypothetical protein [Anaerolineae bacterium]HCK67264.1 hypothetical protein [Anaerolineae bacterium]